MVPILLFLFLCQATLLFAGEVSTSHGDDNSPKKIQLTKYNDFGHLFFNVSSSHSLENEKDSISVPAYDKCSKEFGFTKSEVFHLINSNARHSHSLDKEKCVLQCVYEFFGLMNGNDFDWEAAQRVVDEQMKSSTDKPAKRLGSITKIVSICKEKVTFSDDPCQTASDVHNCLFDESDKTLILPSYYDCAKEFEITYDEMYQLVFYNKPSGHPVEKDKCIVKCKLDYDRMMKGNEYDWALRLKIIDLLAEGSTMLKTYEDLVNNCKTKVSISDDLCQTAYDANSCLVEGFMKIDENPLTYLN